MEYICALAIISFILLVLSNHLVSLFIALYRVPQNLPPRWYLSAWYHTTYTVITLRGEPLFIYFLFIVVCIFASFAWIAKRDGKNAISTLKAALRLKDPTSLNKDNSLILLFRLLLAYFFFFVVYWNIVFFLGYDFSPSPNRNLFSSDDLFGLADSAVYEELFFRMSLIGVPLFIVAVIQFVARQRKRLPAPHRFFLGGGSHFGALPLFFLVVSSLNFAYAHVRLSPQEPAMLLFLPTLLAGLILGYLFLEKGIHTAVIFHFCVNYMIVLSYADYAGLVPELVALIFLPLSLGAMILVCVFGAVAGPFYFLLYSKAILLFIKTGAQEAGLLRGKDRDE